MSSKEIETIGMAKELIHEEVSMGFCTCSHENEVCIIYGIMYIHTYCTMLKTSHPISMYAFEYVFCIYVCVRTSSVCPFLFVINSSMHSCLYMSLYQLMQLSYLICIRTYLLCGFDSSCNIKKWEQKMMILNVPLQRLEKQTCMTQYKDYL